MTGGAVPSGGIDPGSPRPVTTVVADDQALVRGGFGLILRQRASTCSPRPPTASRRSRRRSSTGPTSC